MQIIAPRIPFAPILSAVLLGSSPFLAADEAGWWDKAWTQRQQFTVDGTVTGGGADAPAPLLVRISEGAVFAAAREDGGDLRFVSADGKTVLPHHLERYDSLLGEAYVWVAAKVPKSGKETFHLYFGNPEAPAPGKASDAYGPDLAAVYHFAERGSPPVDSTANANNAAAAGASADGAIIGSGLRLDPGQSLTITPKESLAWTAGKPASVSMWLKPGQPSAAAAVLTRGEGAAAFRLLLDQGAPVLEIAGGGTPVRTAPGSPLQPNNWAHIAVSSDGAATRVFVNGEAYASASAGIPALSGPITLGAPSGGFAGELDELRFHSVALAPEAVKLEYVNQGGSEAASKLLSAGGAEGGKVHGGKVLEHIMLFGDIANNMMFDGWIAIGICVIMIVVGWTVALRKFFYLNKIERGNREFMRQWKTLATDLTALDHTNSSTIRAMGGTVNEEDQDLMKDSPLYHIYHIGSEEISHRLDKLSDKLDGLPGRSIQAVRASLDSGLVHENHRLTDGLVFLTISIAGGPYVGLLGTVVGVMITFAIIAKSGEVNVNSIAPGIASALLATVVGLIVAIPALFIYSYLNSRIKKVVSTMQVFIDEFVAKMAEFYRPRNEIDTAGNGH
ncbi:MAG: DUF2341 domain-containing protein [Verrucomicrobia bacterium]|nr:DUF2341 domain-containing protein [Verrucomicrobiota bacterium]